MKHWTEIKDRKARRRKYKAWYRTLPQEVEKNRIRAAVFRTTSAGKKYSKDYRDSYNYNPNGRFNKARHQSKQRNIKWTIKRTDYKQLIENPCYYCDGDLSVECGTGLDRIDNKKGYIINNVLPCCGSCNRTRGDRWTVEETKAMIKVALKIRRNSMEGLTVVKENAKITKKE